LVAAIVFMLDPVRCPTGTVETVTNRTPTTSAAISRRRSTDMGAQTTSVGADSTTWQTSRADVEIALRAPVDGRVPSIDPSRGQSTSSPTNNWSDYYSDHVDVSYSDLTKLSRPELRRDHLSSDLPPATFTTERTYPNLQRYGTWVVRPCRVASPAARRSHRCAKPPWVDGSNRRVPHGTSLQEGLEMAKAGGETSSASNRRLMRRPRAATSSETKPATPSL